MRFQLNTDASIRGDERLAEVAELLVLRTLGHLTERLSRVEVHLEDVNGLKGGPDDIRCTVEARPEGMLPQTVTHSAGTVREALVGGARKSRTLLERRLGKLRDRRGERPWVEAPEAVP